MTEVEILAHHHVVGPKLTHQHSRDERPRGLLGLQGSETKDANLLDAQRLETFESLIKCAELQGRTVGRQHEGGVGIKRDHRGAHLVFLRQRAHFTQYLLVAKVQSVKNSDGHHARCRAGSLFVAF
jgi:hypothetical protein